MTRLLHIIIVCVTAFAALPLRAQQAPEYSGFDHVELAVMNRERALEFYSRLFGMELREQGGRHYLQLGQSHLVLASNADARVEHIGYGAEAFDVAAAQRWLTAQRIPWQVAAVTGADTLRVSDRDGITSEVARHGGWDVVANATRVAQPDAAAPIFTAYAIDEVFLTVTDLEVDSLFYARLLDQTGTLQAGSLWFRVGPAARLRLTQAPVGQTAGISYFAVHVAYTDMEAAADAVFAAGGIIENILPNGFSFWDPDGIRVVVRSGDLY